MAISLTFAVSELSFLQKFFNMKEKCYDFIDSAWEAYKDEFSSSSIDEETLEALTKIVLYNVIRRRITIDKVKKGVNL